MRGKLSTRSVCVLMLLLMSGAWALAVVAVPALAGTPSSSHTSTAPGVTTAAPRTLTPASVPATTKNRVGPLLHLSCVTTRSGRVADCPRHLAASRMPAGARDESTIASPTSGGLARLVDTRTWTSGGGNTFPGAEVPFGMVQWSPDTMPTYNAGGEYDYSDNKLWGYSLTHVSGPGCGAAGDVPMVPTTGALPSGDPNISRRRSVTPMRWRKPATTPRRATSRTPSPRSSRRHRTARWRASPTQPRLRRTS